jgi:hypothetical protein
MSGSSDRVEKKPALARGCVKNVPRLDWCMTSYFSALVDFSNRSATNIPNACTIANIVLNDAMILPYDANRRPDGIFGKGNRDLVARDKFFGCTNRLAGIAAVVTRNELKFLAKYAARGVDLVDGQLCAALVVDCTDGHHLVAVDVADLDRVLRINDGR